LHPRLGRANLCSCDKIEQRGNQTYRRAFRLLDLGEPFSKGLPYVPSVTVRAEGTDQNKKNACPSEAISRSERARARARYLSAQIARLPDDAEVQRLRELSMDYIREAERTEKEGVNTEESSEQISAALDAIAYDFFARPLREKSKVVVQARREVAVNANVPLIDPQSPTGGDRCI
jgi:hypothetical protein